MKRLVAGVFAVALFTLAACGNGDEPIDMITPTPWSTPRPTATGTPSQADLSAMAEETYRAAFEEWKRLERRGGASDATPNLSEHAEGAYLDSVLTALTHQKEQGVEIEGPIPTTRVTGQPGQSRDNSDPRMTLLVCEDNTASIAKLNGKEVRGSLVEGTVYVAERSGRLKVISSSTKEVAACGS